ncbi:LAME_0H19944g1_1 [Lachancea meyersii CBS 8951]|uniref:LAME_0H19944g1_1 n=1 Tax=Lachancea meyersii CBS 8951 TaxID=1266667 RepID=A0A1G4KJG0_9SACH|nr:LAME_0H19944g1_1 [Lachancea meyersii CBS 8951]
MSTDTMYMNSSRRLPAAGRNKTSQLQKPEKKTTRNHRKNKTRQEGNPSDDTVPLPQPQALPNGEKPNFGGFNKKDRKTNSNRPENSTTNFNGTGPARTSARVSQNSGSGSDVTSTPAGRKTAELLAKNLRDVVLVENEKGGITSVPCLDNRTQRQMTPQSLPSASPNQSPSPLSAKEYAPVALSPLPNQPGLYQQQLQQQQLQQLRQNQHFQYYQNQHLQQPLLNQHLHAQQNRFAPIIPLGMQQPGPNYALSSGATPYYNAMHVPFMNSNTPQTPGFYGVPPPAPPPMNLMPGHFPQAQPVCSPGLAPLGNVSIMSSGSTGSEISGPVTSLSEEPRVSSSSSASIPNASDNLNQNSDKKPSKKSRAGAKLARGGYAGASFATSVPAVTNLPKPSFT